MSLKRRAALMESQYEPSPKIARTTSLNQTIRNTVQREVRKEKARMDDLKYTDTAVNNQSVTSSGTIYNVLGNLVRGDNGLNGFDGNTITPRGLTVKYMFNTNQVYNQVRLLCFQWMDSAVPTLAGIVQNNTTNISTLSSILVTNRSFIRVLYDKTHVIAPTAGDGSTPIGLGVCYGQFFIPQTRLKKIRFNSGTSSVQDGAIYILVVSDDSAPTYPAVNMYTRLSFYD